jgi:hypothetical protein
VFFCKIVHLNVIVNALVQISTIHYQKKWFLWWICT